jgi:hypothetical protein
MANLGRLGVVDYTLKYVEGFEDCTGIVRLRKKHAKAKGSQFCTRPTTIASMKRHFTHRLTRHQISAFLPENLKRERKVHRADRDDRSPMSVRSAER